MRAPLFRQEPARSAEHRRPVPPDCSQGGNRAFESQDLERIAFELRAKSAWTPWALKSGAGISEIASARFTHPDSRTHGCPVDPPSRWPSIPSDPASHRSSIFAGPRCFQSSGFAALKKTDPMRMAKHFQPSRRRARAIADRTCLGAVPPT